MAEWLYEAGIGEARAALVEGDRIVEALIEPDDGVPRVGAVLSVRLIEREGRRGIARSLDGAHEGLIDRLDPALTLGQALNAEVIRAAIPEPGAVKRMKLRVIADAPRPGPDLKARIEASGLPVRTLAPHGPDLLEHAGWSEMLEAAATGRMDFPGGCLRISLTPAMTLIDVDGALPPPALALAGAKAAAAAIRAFGIAGSIGIDLPSVEGKAERAAQGAAIDAVLPPPFERTAVNGFGFVQIVRPRLRASLCERLQFDAAAAHARALLRRAERSGLTGATTLVAHPAVVAALRPNWCAALGARLGGTIVLHSDPSLAMPASHATRSI